MTDLRTAAQQALEDLKDLHKNHNITYAGTISRLEAALAQQQANPPGCDHCNHPLYAATRCRVCGKVTEQAEPKGGGNLPPPLQEPAVAEAATTQQQLADTPPSDYRRSYLDGYFDGFAIGKREGRIEAEDAAKQAEPVAWMDIDRDGTRLSVRMWSDGNRDEVPLYTAPPKAEPNAEYERGFIDGMQKQAQSSVDKAVNRMAEQAMLGVWQDVPGAVNFGIKE